VSHIEHTCGGSVHGAKECLGCAAAVEERRAARDLPSSHFPRSVDRYGYAIRDQHGTSLKPYTDDADRDSRGLKP